jgi:hypothetical protein
MSQFDFEEEDIDLEEPNEIKWKYEQFPGGRITTVYIYLVKYNRKGFLIEPVPIVVDGFFDFETFKGGKHIEFKYYHGVLATDLKSLPYTKPQQEIIKDRLETILKGARIHAGAEAYRFVEQKKYALALLICLGLGALTMYGWALLFGII